VSINQKDNENQRKSCVFKGNDEVEVEKWKKFGYLVAESYDELKKENEKMKAEKEKDKKIISALKE
jgi:hypothetical protein